MEERVFASIEELKKINFYWFWRIFKDKSLKRKEKQS
jgi:hypothetical protein